MSRIVTLQGTFSDSDVRFHSLRGREALSSLYEFDIEVLSSNFSLDTKQTLGTALHLSIALDKGGPRRLSGQVTRMKQIGQQGTTSRDYIYRLSVRPWLWFLTCTSDCKIFQNKSVVEILDEVFSDYDYPVEKRLKATYRQWEYCAQYQESDFSFVSRLMEQEGIYYYFEHSETGEKLVLADDISAHKSIPGYPELPYLPPDRVVNADEVGVRNWQAEEELRPGSYMVSDYDFTKPKADMRQRRITPQRHANDQFEMYDWMSGFIDQEHAENYSRIRLEEVQALRERTQAYSQLPGILPGFTFTLTGHPRSAENRAYLVVCADYDFREGGYATGSEPAVYDTQFIVQPANLPYRAPRDTPYPFANGMQTAVVVGPAGEEIWTDQYGRVKVQFHWDRYGQNNENSSCWMRVASNWAGSHFGSQHTPRIGQEVLVSFIGGRLDRPIVAASVYNADNMPPFDLPAGRTQTGVITRSFEHGSRENANMLRFDDKRGAEQVCLHAERNLDIEVEGDETLTVCGNRTKHVHGNEHCTVDKDHCCEVHGKIHTRCDTSINTEALQSICTSAVVSILQQTLAYISTTGTSLDMTGLRELLTGIETQLTGSHFSCTGSDVRSCGHKQRHAGSHCSTYGSSVQVFGAGIVVGGAFIGSFGNSCKKSKCEVKKVQYKVTC
jgi:type VI secretion system secreted protein VgrG